jgi:hypothetical protein
MIFLTLATDPTGIRTWSHKPHSKSQVRGGGGGERDAPLLTAKLTPQQIVALDTFRMCSPEQ